MRWCVGLAGALLAVLTTVLTAGLTTVLTTVLVAAPAQASDRTPTVPAIVAGLREDPVYVAGDATARLDAADLAQLHGDVRAAAYPLWVVVLHHLPTGVTSTKALAHRIAEEREGPGWVVVYADDTLPAFGGSYPRSEDDEDFVSAMVNSDHDQGTAAQRLLLLTGRLAGRVDNPSPFPFAQPDPPAPPAPTRVRVGRVVVLAASVLLGLGLVAAVAWLLLRSGAGRWRSARLERQVARGTEADRSIRARREVLELGALLDATELAPGDDATRWQQALDAYDMAGRLLDRATGTAQLDQVLALCAQGRRHADAVRPGGLRVPRAD